MGGDPPHPTRTDEMSSHPTPRGDHGPGSAVGLEPGMRFRCEGCGNLTRFDVEVAERSRRFWHVSVSGIGEVEEVDVLEQSVTAVTCRWCGAADRIVTEPAPAAAADQADARQG